MKHKLLEIINVKQGDCLLLRPQNCNYRGEAFIVDTGNGKYDFTKFLPDDEYFHVVLTHAHADHINGVNLLLSTPRLSKMKSLILPYYHNESVLIAEALLNLKGMSKLSDKYGLRLQLNQIIANQLVLINLTKGVEIKFIKDGDALCSHISILNPPCHYSDQLTNLNDESIHEFSSLFNPEFSSEISTFLIMSKAGNIRTDTPYINSLFLNHNEDQISSSKINFFVEFILDNNKDLISFNEHPTEHKLYKLIERKKLKEHQACIVFRCKYDGKWFLFGGDADKSVWNRLIKEDKDISAHYLKIPHHGSRKNMNKKIMTKINPTIAIISHNNGIFGRALDGHPNVEIFNLIQNEGIKLISTNDIIKSGNIVWDCFKDNETDKNVEVKNI